MAAVQNLSPGGALLRASRMFAIPAPLPRPQGNYQTGSVFGSETGTAPHPLHLSITTPPSSLSRGDWGLKRPLPLRSTTKSSTPFIRVTTMDTFEHVTEFASAADHTLTLKKWQALHLPMSTPKIKKHYLGTPTRKTANKSVFDEDIDYTVPRELKPGEQVTRWKFNGPWLAGQTDMEFNDYLKKEVRRRKTDFHHFLRQEYVSKHNSDMMEKARDDGNVSEVIPIALSDVTEEQFNTYLRELRGDETTLFSLIRQFFDLPPAPSIPSLRNLDQDPDAKREFIAHRKLPPIDTEPEKEPTNPYAISGPPKTHPSGGLSYLRSAAYMTNHPLFGPQAKKPPIQARVIMPQNAGVGNFGAKFGVAGMVVEVPSGPSGFNASNISSWKDRFNKGVPLDGLKNIELDVPGGTKTWLELTGASLNPLGMVQLSVNRATEFSVNVAEGKAPIAPGASRKFGQRSGDPNRPTPFDPRFSYGLTSTVFGEDEDKPKSTPEGVDALQDFIS